MLLANWAGVIGRAGVTAGLAGGVLDRRASRTSSSLGTGGGSSRPRAGFSVGRIVVGAGLATLVAEVPGAQTRRGMMRWTNGARTSITGPTATFTYGTEMTTSARATGASAA